jgi:hypothetical protein
LKSSRISIQFKIWCGMPRSPLLLNSFVIRRLPSITDFLAVYHAHFPSYLYQKLSGIMDLREKHQAVSAPVSLITRRGAALTMICLRRLSQL